MGTNEDVNYLLELTHTSINHLGGFILEGGFLTLVVLLVPCWCTGPEHIDSLLFELI